MFLGLDLGTSGLRGLLVSAEGAAIGDASHGYAVVTPHEGWSEQDPGDWITACQMVMAALRQAHPDAFAAITGIGIAGQMHGATLLDDAGDVIRPCILWNDTRAVAEAAELDAIPEFRALSGNIVFPGFTAPKLKWVKRNEPEAFARVAKVLLPKDYLVYWLTGRYVSDMSDAAGTSWLDVGARDWSDRLIESSGMTRAQLPDLVEGSEVVGEVRPSRTAELGLPAAVSVVGGGGDNAVAACGMGAFREGQGFVSLGTSGVLLAAKDSYAPMPSSAVHTFCHAVPGKWYQMGVILSATDSLNWLADMVGRSPQDLSDQLTDAPAGPSAIRFLPYLSGERTPHNDATARGAFLGLAKKHNEADLAQAVMEGVVFALRDCLEALKSTGTDLERVLAIGGGSKSTFWVQTLANILDLPIDLPEKGDFGAALGAARLAMVGAGGQTPDSVMTPPAITRTIESNSSLRDAYQVAYEKYAASYAALKELI
jgi:xylulokinase